MHQHDGGKRFCNLRSGGMMRGPLLGAATRRSAGGGSEILGYNTIGGTSVSAGANTLLFQARFSPSQTGTITQVEIYSSNSSAVQDIKIAIYNDSAGEPSTLVATETEFTDIGTWSLGWKAFTVSYSVTSGSNYWISFNLSNASVTTLYYDTLSNCQSYKTQTYSNAFPSPATGLSTFSQNISARATNTY